MRSPFLSHLKHTDFLELVHTISSCGFIEAAQVTNRLLGQFAVKKTGVSITPGRVCVSRMACSVDNPLQIHVRPTENRHGYDRTICPLLRPFKSPRTRQKRNRLSRRSESGAWSSMFTRAGGGIAPGCHSVVWNCHIFKAVRYGQPHYACNRTHATKVGEIALRRADKDGRNPVSRSPPMAKRPPRPLAG